MVGLGWPGVNEEPGAGIVGRLVAGVPGAESTGDGEPGATHPEMDHVRARIRMSRRMVLIPT